MHEFNRATGLKLSNGYIMLLPSPQTTEKNSVYTHKQIIAEDFRRTIDELTQNYSKEKVFDFSMCYFVPKAQEIHADRMLKEISSEVELRELYAERLEQSAVQESKRIAEFEGGHRREYRKLEQKMNVEIEKRKSVENNAKQLQNELNKQKIETEEYAKRLIKVKDRPARSSGVCDWVTKHFSSRVTIHKRAEKAMKEIQNDEIDISLICDALEFLASEHWDVLNGVISSEECNIRCLRNYNRPFEAVPNSDSSMRMYPNDYTVSYKTNGNESNEQLNMHLKLGTDPMRLIRIYFFYDRVNKKIVVGSMPKHLRIVSG